MRSLSALFTDFLKPQLPEGLPGSKSWSGTGQTDTRTNHLMKTYLARTLALVSISSVFAMSGYATTTIESVPFTITKAGTYVLDGNLTLSGTGLYAVTVDASNVVIDLNGFTLKNGTGTNNGILTTSAAMNVTIQDGTITGFSNAVGLQGSEELVQNLRLFNNGNGIEASSSNFDTIQGCFIVGLGSTLR